MDKIFQELKRLKKLVPEQRIGQIIDNAVFLQKKANVFYVSDKDLLFALKEYRKKINKS